MTEWETIDPKLARRAKQLLTDLTMLSYAPTSSPLSLAPPGTRSRIACPSCRGEGEVSATSFDPDVPKFIACCRCKGTGEVAGQAAPRSTQPHHESREPQIDKEHGEIDSLYEQFIGPISHAFHNDDGATLRALCVQVETAISQYRGLHKPEMELPSDDTAAMRKVCEVYVGVHPVEVARRLHVAPGWVEKARRTGRRKPEDGSKLAGWRGWSDEERLDHVQHAREHGWSIRRTAFEYAVPSSTLHDNYGHHFA